MENGWLKRFSMHLSPRIVFPSRKENSYEIFKARKFSRLLWRSFSFELKIMFYRF
jgi:hypothetical protein